jgi:hypothetical protein
MKFRIATLALGLLLAFASLSPAASAFAQSNPPPPAQQPDRMPFTGVWRGQAEGLPALTLVLTDEGGSLSGAVLFYLHMRKSVNDPWTSTPGLPEPLLHLNLDGNTLTFQVSHRRAHPPRTLPDPPVTFTLTLNNDGTALLANQSEHAPGLPLTRTDY